MTVSRHTRTLRIIPFLIAVCLVGFPAQAKYGGGSGTAQDPYQIATAADLIALGETPADYDKHFILTADIDLDPKLPGRKVFDKAVIAPASPTEVYPYVQGTPFTGVFDGKGHKILHLTIKGKDHLGLFGRLGSGAQVEDLGVVDVNIVGSGGLVGGLAGFNGFWDWDTAWDRTGSNVTNCYSTGAVSATGQSESVGGLVGFNGGTVTQCHSIATTSAVGYNSSVGGLVGYNNGNITLCYSTGAVSGTGQSGSVGGLVGSNAGAVTNCYSTGAVSGTGEFQRVGGLVGWGAVTNCYSTGAVNATGQYSHVGGLVGTGGAGSASFWNTQTSGQAKSDGGTGKTTTEMQDIRTYRSAGWDFWRENADGIQEIWQMPQGGGYPVLAVFGGYAPPQLQGQGTAQDPYLIRNPVELGAMVYQSPYAQYRLTASIDLSGIRWAAAVIPWFGGTFDGNGHTISHLTIKGGGDLGLFGRLASNTTVKNLGVVDVNITGSGDHVGGLAGENMSWGTTVTQCYSTGAVRGAGGYVGGLMGSNGGAVTNCYSMAVVSGSGYVGGLAGENRGTVTQCYSSGAVSGSWSVGGLVGSNGGAVTNCFWDVQTSSQTTSAGGTGKTTAEMQMAKTFLGWGGCGPVWTIDDGRDYPHLAWESMPGRVITGPVYGGGTGTVEDPYLIYTAEQLNAIGLASCHWDKHFQLMADIDLSGFDGRDGRPNFNFIAQGYIGELSSTLTPFTGVFDGSGHRILHLTARGAGCNGLFGWLGDRGQVKNLGLVDVNVIGCASLVGGNNGTVTHCYATGAVDGSAYPYPFVGGLVGSNGGAVTQCYSAAGVRGGLWIGGLVGYNGGAVTQCYSTAAVSGDAWVGGLVGYNDGGTVTQCYNTGAVRGGGWIGGLVGYNGRGSVTQCYSAGAVSGSGSIVGGLVGGGSSWSVTACFWDTQTSGQATSFGGTGKTTAEMRTAKTFLNAGWDFVGETKYVRDDIWWILEGKDYPKLFWERGQARLSYPQDGASDVAQRLIVRWSPGGLALQHDVYFGEDADLVASATRETMGIYRGRQPAGATSYDPGALGWAKTYYWRIDEVDEADPNSVRKGDVWRFTIADFIIVTVADDFESCTEGSQVGPILLLTWLGGQFNGTGSFVYPFAEQGIVHGGLQSMAMLYTTAVKPWYAEAHRTWVTPQDWTIGGADTLTLYLRGDPNNSRESLYVGIEDSAGRIAVMVHSDPAAVLATEWQKWHIALADVWAAGVDMAAVKKMYIGVGDRPDPSTPLGASPKPGGTGRIYIDDIRLTKRMP